VRALVTGAGGFIGSHLVELLARTGHAVTALVRRPGAPLPGAGPSVDLWTGDVLDADFVGRAVATARPDVVFHLAAQSLPVRSWTHVGDTMATNVMGSLNVLEAVREHARAAVVVVAGSSAEYPPSSDPIPEDCSLMPSTPYGVSKVAQDHLARLYGQAHGLTIIRARPFFLIGPRKRADVCSDLARAVVAVERGERAELVVGNLAAVRDFVDVRDGVAAFSLLAERGRTGEAYNIASGAGHPIQDVLTTMKRLARIDVVERVDPARLRPLDEPVKVGNPQKLMALGWRPTRPLATTLADVLEYWRAANEPAPTPR
jgi:GDP-4-dehydro-6-deoxy-D-mannose reductase